MPKLYFYNREFSFDGGKSILDVLLDNGQDIPYSCKIGVCVTCVMQPGICRVFLQAQQTDFMVDLFGASPKTCFGKFPMPAHQHLYITEEIFQLRQDLLAKSLRQSNVSEEHIERWLAFDAIMKKAVVKESVDECEKRFNTDEIIVVPKPG